MQEGIPTRDVDFNNWGPNFAAVANANAITLKISIAEVTQIEGAAGAFAVDYQAVVDAKSVLHGAVAGKDAQRASSEAIYRKFAKIFLANPNLDPVLLSELGLKVTPSPSGPVVPVSDLSASGFSNGTNSLKWRRNGNAKGTVFVIEAQIGGSSTWTNVGATTKAKFVHSNVTPGTQMIYRVISQRGNTYSAPSNTAIVYGQGNEATGLKLAA